MRFFADQDEFEKLYVQYEQDATTSVKKQIKAHRVLFILLCQRTCQYRPYLFAKRRSLPILTAFQSEIVTLCVKVTYV